MYVASLLKNLIPRPATPPPAGRAGHRHGGQCQSVPRPRRGRRPGRGVETARRAEDRGDHHQRSERPGRVRPCRRPRPRARAPGAGERAVEACTTTTSSTVRTRTDPRTPTRRDRRRKAAAPTPAANPPLPPNRPNSSVPAPPPADRNRRWRPHSASAAEPSTTTYAPTSHRTAMHHRKIPAI